jgi:hypothetical protein
MLPEVEDFTNIRSPQLDAQPALKHSMLRQLLTHGTWMDAAQQYQRATGVEWEEARRVIKPLDDAVRVRKARVPVRPNGKSTHTLDDLDDINWWVLEHANGAASDVPWNIQDLVSSHAAIRAEALDNLFSSLAHQGSVYSATAVAVPFLVELVRTSDAPDRDQIFRLLDRIAFWHYWEVYEQPLRGYRPAISRTGEQAFNAVRAGIPVYLELLDEPLSGLQLPALRVLCRFRGDSGKIVPHIRHLLEADPDGDLFPMLAFSLSYFDMRGSWAAALCERLLHEEEITARTFAAATTSMRLSPKRPPAEAIRALTSVAAYPQRYADLATVLEEMRSLYWPLRPAAILTCALEPVALAAAPILIDGLAERGGADEHLEIWRFHDLARTIIDMLFTNAHLPQRPGEPLVAARTAALRAITEHPCLTDDQECYETLRGLLPLVFRDGVLGRDTSARQLTPEHQAVLKAFLRNWAWSAEGLSMVEMARHLLAAFFGRVQWMPGMPATDITDAQRAILEAIAGSGYWARELSRFPEQPLEELLRPLALPETQEELRAYMGSDAS